LLIGLRANSAFLNTECKSYKEEERTKRFCFADYTYLTVQQSAAVLDSSGETVEWQFNGEIPDIIKIAKDQKWESVLSHPLVQAIQCRNDILALYTLGNFREARALFEQNKDKYGLDRGIFDIPLYSSEMMAKDNSFKDAMLLDLFKHGEMDVSLVRGRVKDFSPQNKFNDFPKLKREFDEIDKRQNNIIKLYSSGKFIEARDLLKNHENEHPYLFTDYLRSDDFKNMDIRFKDQVFVDMYRHKILNGVSVFNWANDHCSNSRTKTFEEFPQLKEIVAFESFLEAVHFSKMPAVKLKELSADSIKPGVHTLPFNDPETKAPFDLHAFIKASPIFCQKLKAYIENAEQLAGQYTLVRELTTQEIKDEIEFKEYKEAVSTKGKELSLVDVKKFMHLHPDVGLKILEGLGPQAKNQTNAERRITRLYHLAKSEPAQNKTQGDKLQKTKAAPPKRKPPVG
jgi:hypothetical protein